MRVLRSVLVCAVCAGGAAVSEAQSIDEFAPAESTLQPFARGDVFIGATLLNDPDDDHAGRGRILQFDADLMLKGVLWIEDTSHLIGGLTFGSDNTLWAFDNFAWLVVRVKPDGTLLPAKKFADRPFGSVQFLDNGNFVLIEYLKGSAQPEQLTTRYPYLPDDPASVGHGEIYEYDARENLVRTFMPDVHGGVSGSMGATHTTLASDGHTLIYTSETGPRLMRFDLRTGAQLADLMTLPEAPPGAPPAMMFDVERLTDDRLVLPLGTKVTVLRESGEEVASFPLEGFGWALVAPGLNGETAYAANWFTGQVVKLSLEDGDILARVTIAPKCLAGIVQFH
ncbi:MAG: hypothetical protein OXG29_01080 [Gammaproteobacteria bacterium]|nr:hypothetical protein [Gammaproteobacteria bacterium]MCY3987255.1 hypothetical protein [Gammaproteobacteria bacterium]